jgi:hypothetical protein
MSEDMIYFICAGIGQSAWSKGQGNWKLVLTSYDIRYLSSDFWHRAPAYDTSAL